MLKLLTFLLRFSPRMVGLVIATGLLAGISSAGLIALINSSISRTGQDNTHLTLAFVALGLTMMFSGFVSRALLIELSQNAIFELRLRLSRQILAAPLLVLEKYGAPRLLASLIDDVMVVTGALLGIPALCINLATILVCLIYLGWLSWQVLVAVIFFMALGMVSYSFLMQKALRYLAEARQQQNKLFADFRALTQGTKELKLHVQRREDFLDNRLRRTGADFRRFNIIGSRIYAGADSWGQFLFFVFIGLTLYALPALREVSSGVVVGYILALLFMMAPIEVLLNFIPNIGRARIALQQIEGLGLSLDKAAEGDEGEGERPPADARWRRLELVNVTHTYHQENSDESFTLGPLSMSIEAGETVYLIGGNGSGKTTLVKLITGLYVPEAGEVRLDGRPVAAADREWYRGHFSAVFSDFFLFENLFGLSADGADALAADYLAKLHLDHKVKVTGGEFSTLELSQGQRKRLALLTALMEDRAVYVFDEWAADQDPVFKKVFYTEFLPALKARGKTVLVITHDDAYFSLADRVLKLENGQLVSPAALPAAEAAPEPASAGVGHERRADSSLAAPAADIRSLPAPASTPGDGARGAAPGRRGAVEDSQAGRGLNGGGPARTRVAPGRSRADLVRGAAALMFAAAVVATALSLLRPPAPAPAGAPATDFSSGRALRHLPAIAGRPHPVGSLAQAEVREYIVAELRRLGLSPEVRPASAADNIRGEILAGTAHNIAARLPGTQGGKAVALVAHYDSTPYGPGAGDNGAAVAALLETARALKAGPPLRNDLLFLFTDGEEELMLGARAFRAEDPLLREIALLLNFEARGTGGPSIMFETSRNNGWLIRQYARAAPHPVANSLSGEIYRLMPNATDFTIFREAGVGGLNFAYIGGPKNYHTALDNQENLDERSLQHHGLSALALARHFGDLRLDAPEEPDAVYFNTLGTGFVSYPASWLLPLLALCAAGLAGVLLFGRRRGAWTLKEVALGAAGMLLGLLLAPGLVWLVWWILGQAQASLGTTPRQALYKSDYFGVGWVALATTIFVSLYNMMRWKLGPLSLAAGGLAVWLLLLTLSVVFVPGGSYLLVWPLLGATAGMLVLLLLPARGARLDSWRHWLTACLCSLPALLLFVPLISLVHVALGANSFIGLAVLTALLWLGLLPWLYFVTAAVRWVLPLGAGAAAAACLFVGVLPGAYDRQHPQPYHLLYALNADTGGAVWASADSQPNEWTEQFLSAEPRRGDIAEYAPSNFKGFLQRPAGPIDAPAPGLTALEDRAADGVRELRLRLTSPRQAPVAHLFAAPGTRVLSATLMGKQIDFGDRPAANDTLFKKLLTYHGVPPEGVELRLRVPAGSPLRLVLMDQTYGLPLAARTDAPPRARPDHLIPLSFTYSDATLVQKTFVF
ncbi:MAG TPA: cyclic peptide export ABC transporter [Pyrinomonadaceae bacterium]|nr:cyclic peptide export ABC transporter [Pyrinomonadaceae bacterium]